MEINEVTMGYFDIIWFAKDRDGNVLVGSSLESDIPAFVKSSRERAEQAAMELFGIHAVDRQRWPAFDIMKQVEEKRFYLYVANDAFESIYRRIYEPSGPARFDELPDSIRECLRENIVPFSASETETFTISESIFFV
ncbi:MAG: hypothetical protein J6U38_04860 [Clostridia bacterium]|nr:hypothetical protein [Clostridia bacterium]MBP5767179.1 hypothetical protein [Clostridia bacterium]